MPFTADVTLNLRVLAFAIGRRPGRVGAGRAAAGAQLSTGSAAAALNNATRGLVRRARSRAPRHRRGGSRRLGGADLRRVPAVQEPGASCSRSTSARASTASSRWRSICRGDRYPTGTSPGGVLPAADRARARRFPASTRRRSPATCRSRAPAARTCGCRAATIGCWCGSSAPTPPISPRSASRSWPAAASRRTTASARPMSR